MSQTKPHASVPLPHPPSQMTSVSAGFPRGDPETAEFTGRCDPPFWAATFRGEGGVICSLI